MEESTCQCITCGQTKPITEFVPRRSGVRKKHTNRCKACHNAIEKQRRAENPEPYRQADARHKQKKRLARPPRTPQIHDGMLECIGCGHTKPLTDFYTRGKESSKPKQPCRGCYAARGAKVYIERGEAIRANVHQWNIQHPGAALARVRQWAKEHPEQCAAQRAARRAHLANAPINDLTKKEWEAIKEHYNYRCVYCGKKPKRLTQEHITPLSKGGSHTFSNVVPACRSCNSRKKDRAPLKPVQPLLFPLTG